MLVLAFLIDFKYRIIPNRLTLTIFEFGILITFIYGIININMVTYYLLGSLLVTIIFGVIACIGRIFAGKEAMGFGDLKFMGGVGLYYGITEVRTDMGLFYEKAVVIYAARMVMTIISAISWFFIYKICCRFFKDAHIWVIAILLLFNLGYLDFNENHQIRPDMLMYMFF